MTDEEKAENKHWLSQIALGEWYSNAQYYYKPRNEKERNLMHSCYEEGYNNGFSDRLAEVKEIAKDIDFLTKENAEHKAQIEKMKNVGNCKHAMQCPDWVEHKIKNDGIKPCLNCIKWELEE